MDFKARLRKVSGSKDTTTTKSSNSPTKAESPNEQLKLDKRESFGNSTNNTDGGLATSQITEQQSDTGKFNQESHYFKKIEFSHQKKKVCIFRHLNRKCAKKGLAI